MSDRPDYATGYARSHKIYEVSGIILAAVALGALGFRLVGSGEVSGWWIPLTVFVGLLGADFTSGFVHWLFDTWGSTATPVVGQLAIRTFREHHVDQHAMTRHGFVETNGHNITLSMIPSLAGYFALENPTLPRVLLAMSCLSMALCVASTSQIHKWAHASEAPGVVRLLQRAGLIIGARHHKRHHLLPHDSHYCITVGWMNGPLEIVHFFRGLERLITAVTGAVPRAEDLGTAAASHAIAPPAPLSASGTEDVAARADVI